MKLSDTDILFIPGLGDSGGDHWQSRWQGKLSTARRVEQADFDHPDRAMWVDAIVAAVKEGTRPTILVAHDLGVIATAHAAPRLGSTVIGAYLVAPRDPAQLGATAPSARGFAPVPLARLPFRSALVASRNDPSCPIQAASDLAEAWGSDFVDAGESGHLDEQSGHGPWPEGLMRFAGFLAKLG
jgi:uncharacterized protein